MIYYYRDLHKEIKNEEIKKYIFDTCLDAINYSKKIISLEDYIFTLKELAKLYTIMKVINIINEKFFVLIIINIIIFYSPLDNYSEHFLFKAKIAVKQIFEGVFGIIECLIPRYEESKNKN